MGFFGSKMSRSNNLLRDVLDKSKSWFFHLFDKRFWFFHLLSHCLLNKFWTLTEIMPENIFLEKAVDPMKRSFNDSLKYRFWDDYRDLHRNGQLCFKLQCIARKLLKSAAHIPEELTLASLTHHPIPISWIIVILFVFYLSAVSPNFHFLDYLDKPIRKNYFNCNVSDLSATQSRLCNHLVGSFPGNVMNIEKHRNKTTFNCTKQIHRESCKTSQQLKIYFLKSEIRSWNCNGHKMSSIKFFGIKCV